jgi:proteasome lid subunit RPN8/RPN11
MVIAQRFIDDMIAHAREGEPEEVCGILATRNDEVQALYRITNSEHSPVFFVMDPQEQLRAILDIEAQGMDIGAIYHSHTMTAARPSATDIKLAQWPGALSIIVSLAKPNAPEVRAWRISDGQVTEEHLDIVIDQR